MTQPDTVKPAPRLGLTVSVIFVIVSLVCECERAEPIRESHYMRYNSKYITSKTTFPLTLSQVITQKVKHR